MVVDVECVADIIRDVAAVEILPRFRRLESGDVREKDPGDIVTIADEASERELTRRLTELLPGSTVVGEEAYAADPRILCRLHEDAPVWIVDPVDGTQNFASGKPIFAVIVALVRQGCTVGGWIHDPVEGRMATAERGEGVWMAGKRLHAAAPAPLEESVGALKNRFFDRTLRDRIDASKDRLKETFDLYCAGHEYLRLLTGQSHYAMYRKIMPWDHAAGVMMHAEAGGYSARLDGIQYAPTDEEGGLLLAPNKEKWTELRDLVFGS